MKAGWQSVALQEVAEIERNIVEPSAIADGTTYVGLENIETGGIFVNVRSVTNGELASTKFAFTGKHVLYGKLRPYLAKIARPTFSGVCSTDILPILPKAQLDRDYLTYFLRQPSMIDLATSRSTGANLPRLSPKVLAEFSIPLPPIAQQQRIAAILDKAEELRSLRRQALRELDAIVQSIFLEMFGDPATNPKGLLTTTLLKVSRRITDGTHQPPKWSSHGIPFLFVSNIVDGQIDFETQKFISEETHASLMKRCPVEIGDVLYTTVGSYGNAALVTTNRKFSFQRHIAHIKPEISKIDPLFLASMLQSPGIRRQVDKAARGVAQKTVNLADLKDLLIFLPPLSLQQAFARRVEAIAQLKATHRESLAHLDRLFASLQHRAFRGEL